jgi:hypothetical protein
MIVALHNGQNFFTARRSKAAKECTNAFFDNESFRFARERRFIGLAISYCRFNLPSAYSTSGVDLVNCQKRGVDYCALAECEWP